jgi:hypothetical protein
MRVMSPLLWNSTAPAGGVDKQRALMPAEDSVASTGSRHPHSEAVVLWIKVYILIYLDDIKSLPSEGLHA